MGSYKKMREFYILAVLVIFVLPVILVILYDRLAGGIWNCLMASSCKQGIVDGAVFTNFINPLAMLAAYGRMAYVFYKTKSRIQNQFNAAISWLLVIIGALMTLLVVAWPVLTK